MKKRGFTLVELLAVIVILAVIALIAMPVILDVIEKSKMGSFKDSVLSAFHQVDYYLIENNLGEIPEEGLDATKIGLEKSGFKYGEFYQREELEVVNISDGKYCAIGTMENLKVFKGECDLTIPRCSFTIKGEEGTLKWYNKNPMVVMETSEALTGGLKYGIGKEENYNNEVKQGKVGKAEYQTTENETTRVYCYVKNIGDNRGTNYIDVKIDQTAPEEATFSYTTTSKSIRVIASGRDKQSGIARYQFSKDNGATWTSIQESSSYTFDNLETGEYEIKVRVYNGTYVEKNGTNNLYKESETIKVKTEELEAPSYEISPKGWTTGNVKVAIKYNGEGSKLFKTTVNVTSNINVVRCESVYICEGEATREIEAGVWYQVGEDVELTYTENGNVIAQITNGVNYKSGSSMSISNIDSENPTIEAVVNGRVATLTLKDDAQLSGYAVTTTANVPEEWTTISGTLVNETWTASSAGTYYAHVKDAVGRTSYVSFSMVQSSFSYEATKSTSTYGASSRTKQCSCQINSVGSYGSCTNANGTAGTDNKYHTGTCNGQTKRNSVCGYGVSMGEYIYYSCGSEYYCPSGGTLSGSTCTVTTYTCPNGGTLSGTTCVFN